MGTQALGAMALKGKQIVRCPACDADSHSVLGDQNGAILCQCLSCDLRFSEPMLAADEAWYESSPVYLSRADWLGTSRGRITQKHARWEFRQALSSLDSPPKNLLDVGCGYGEFLLLAQEMGYLVTGIDFNVAHLEYVRNVMEISSVHHCSVQELSAQLSAKKFDVVTIFEVLEHIPNPFETICAAQRLLHRGGSLCISMPGYKRWPALFDKVLDSPPHHLTLWTEEALQRMLVRAGFGAIEVRRKPLEKTDLGIHLKWRLQRLLRGARNDRPQSTSIPDLVPSAIGPAGRMARRFAHDSGIMALVPLCELLRLHPRSGGFTLFAHARKV